MTTKCSWKVLFQKAAAEGRARVRHKASPTEENEQALSDAIADHEAYKELCLQSDEMIDLPDYA